MTFLQTTKNCPLSPSQPSPVGASAYAVTGPTRSGCGVSGTPPLSPSPEVLRSSTKAGIRGGRQRSRAVHRVDIKSASCFVLTRLVSDFGLGLCAPYQ